MRYELQLKYYHSVKPDLSKWCTIENFYDTEFGKKAAREEYEYMCKVDKHRSYRLVAVEEIVTVIAE